MKALKRHIDLGLFDNLVPLNETNAAMRAHLAQRLRVEIRGEDTVLFTKGDTGRSSVYLLASAVQAGQVILHQDEVADCYYVIKKGHCSVSRRPAPRARDVKLAELETGQGFGEEALITNATRNASVTMMEDGVLLRRGKEDFINSLAKPLLRHMPCDELMSHRNAVVVDVRTPEEFETDGLVGSLNMPMPVLRLKAHRLDPQRAYVVYSNTGHFSTAAAFILLQHGLDAYVLKGGLSGAPKHRIKHTRSFRHVVFFVV